MLNTNINQNQKLEFTSVSGLMCKSHPKSIICKAHKNPYLLDIYNPRTVNEYGTEVVVLQAMILEDGFLIEYVTKSVYEDGLND